MSRKQKRDEYIDFLKQYNISKDNIIKIMQEEDKKSQDGLAAYIKELASFLYQVEFGTVIMD